MEIVTIKSQHGKSQQVYLKYLKMPDINVLLMLMLVFLFGCQNGKEFSEINDTLIDGKYPKDSILLKGFDPFINEDCAMEISKIIKEEIISSLQEENIKQYDNIWFAITFRGTGEILDFKLKKWNKSVLTFNRRFPNRKDSALQTYGA